MKKILLAILMLTTTTYAKIPENLIKLTAPWKGEQHLLLLDKTDNTIRMIGESDWQSIKNANSNNIPDEIKPDDWLGTVTVNGKMGYINARDEIVIKPQFDDARAFSEDGIARVMVGGKWGFIKPDFKGDNWFIKPQFNRVTPFSQGLSAVQESEDSDYHYIDTHGKKAFDKTFTIAEMFSDNGLAPVAITKEIPIFVVTPTKTDKKITEEDPKWGYINKQGEIVIPIIYSLAYYFNDLGFARVQNVSEQIFFIDAKGKSVTATKFKYFRHFSPTGLAKGETIDGVGGVFDRTGKLIWKVDMIDIGDEINGLYKHRDNNFFDAKGNVVIKETSRWAQPFFDAEATIAMRKEHWGILSRDGSFKVFPEHIVAPLVDADGYVDGFKTGLVATVDDEGALVYLNRKGNTVYRFAPSDKGTMALTDKDDKVIWQSEVKNTKHHSFFVTDESVFKDISDYGDGIYQTIEQLLKAEPKRFHIPNPIFGGNKDPYNLDDEVHSVYKGAIKIVAEKYVDAPTWGSFDFLSDIDGEAFSGFYKKLSEKISKRYGEPLNKAENYSNEKWKIGNKLLTLARDSEPGDGDYYNQIVLMVAEPSDKVDTEQEDENKKAEKQ